MFEFWQVWACFSLGQSRDRGETLPRTRFTPSALVQRSADPNRTIVHQCVGFGPLLKYRPPLKVDGIWGLPPIYFEERCVPWGAPTPLDPPAFLGRLPPPGQK